MLSTHKNGFSCPFTSRCIYVHNFYIFVTPFTIQRITSTFSSILQLHSSFIFLLQHFRRQSTQTIISLVKEFNKIQQGHQNKQGLSATVAKTNNIFILQKGSLHFSASLCSLLPSMFE